MNTQQRFGKTGFTLVELLVVLAVIVFLAATLFAVFSRVREKGRSTVCRGNLRQIALSIQQYVQDHDGWYPSNGGGIEQKQWVSKILPYVRNSQVFVCPTRDGLGDNSIPSYDFNFLRLNTGASRPLFVGRNEAATVYASKVWLLMDHDPPPWDESFIKPTSGCNWWSLDWGQTLHSGGANYSFVDGRIKWLTQQQIADIECSLGEPKFNTP